MVRSWQKTKAALIKLQCVPEDLADIDLVALGWGLNFRISQEFPGDANATGPWTTL